MLDEDGGGTIDRSELEVFLRVVQIQSTEAELDANIRVVDENDDGELDFDEFRHLISVLAQAEARRREDDPGARPSKTPALGSSTRGAPANSAGSSYPV